MTFSHQADAYDDKKIENYGANEDGKHGNPLITFENMAMVLKMGRMRSCLSFSIFQKTIPREKEFNKVIFVKALQTAYFFCIIILGNMAQQFVSIFDQKSFLSFATFFEGLFGLNVFRKRLLWAIA